MITVQHWLTASRIDACMIMQVHDELVFEVATSQTDSVRDKVVELMCNAAKLSVPIQVDVGVGANWDEAH
jgi:DNA polymerase-1